MVSVIDYDAGNIKSVQKALEFLGEKVLVTRNPEEILAAERVILPGVGSVGDGRTRDAVFGNLPRPAAFV